MSVEVYSISIDFPNGINEYQLMTEMNEATLGCTNVITDEDDCLIYFDSVVLKENVDIVVAAHFPQAPSLGVEVTSITSDEYLLSSPLNVLYSAERTNLALTVNIEHDITGVWAPIQGNLTGFDTSTGYYTFPTSGIYFMNLDIETVSTNLLNNAIHIKIRDSQDNIISGESKILRISNTTYARLAHGAFFTAGTSIRYTVEVNSANLTIDAKFSILKFMSV